MAVEQQGVVADRPNEHLGVSDGGILLMRQMMRQALAAVAERRDPPCLVRDPARQRIAFPQRSTMMERRQGDVSYALGERAVAGAK